MLFLVCKFQIHNDAGCFDERYSYFGIIHIQNHWEGNCECREEKCVFFLEQTWKEFERAVACNDVFIF